MSFASSFGRAFGVAVAAFVVSLPACSPDSAPSGLMLAKKTGGPTVVFDLTRLPLPEIPLPNDVATYPDPSSRTGRRINASLVAPTTIERNARQQFDRLEGWGTFSPISIPFDRPIDTDDVMKRHVGDDFDFKDDAVYLVNLKTGVPMPLDVGEGNFPVTLKETARYWPNDPRKTESNLIFETLEEDTNGNGLLDPGEDTDFDGTLDHPNFPGKVRPPNGVDGLLTFYESETNTLIVRPMLPLDEMTEYAVVVTDRLHGVDDDKTPVQSPFDYVHHPEQKESTQRLFDAIGRKFEYYGFSSASETLDHIQFVFTFTTQPTNDLFAFRDGVYGQGKLAWIANEYPPQVQMLEAVGAAAAGQSDPPDWVDSSDACKQQGDKSRYVAQFTDSAKSTIATVAGQVFGFQGPQGDQIVRSYDNIGYLAIGQMKVPWLLGDVKDVSPERTIEYDPATGNIPHTSDTVYFYLTVPKTTADHKPPFPVALYGHGYTGNGTEGLVFAGEMARHGIATIGMNAPGHGLELSDAEKDLAQGFLSSGCLGPLADAFEKNRVRDLNGDGVISGESGGDYWTSYLFHTRDMVRQAVVEQVMMVRALRMFDGKTSYDWKGTGTPSLAGDFDEDGVVDIGGPNGQFFAWGESLGGILSGVQGGVDPYLTATVPVSGGGALSDIGLRSFQGGVVEAVQMRIMSPLVIGVPAESRIDYQMDANGNVVKDASGNPIPLPKAQQTQTICDPGQRSIRFFVVELNKEREIEIGCADATQLDEGDDVVVEDRDSGERRCAKVTKVDSDFDTAQFRIGIPASLGDRLAIGVWRPAKGSVQAVRAYGKDCGVEPSSGARSTLVLDTFQGVSSPCAADSTQQCITYESTNYHPGDPLVAVAEGYGLKRQTPDFRKLLQLAQIALEPADPVTFAPYYYVKPRLDPFGQPAKPTAILTIDTIGDMNVPVNTGITQARVHGAIPFLRPENVAAQDYPDWVAPSTLIDLYGETPNRMLLDNHVIEGIARLGRHPPPDLSACAANANPSFPGCSAQTIDPTTCEDSLFDPENLSEGAIPFHPQHPTTNPLRLARLATHTSEADWSATWGPRVATPWTPNAPLGAVLNPFIVPQGVHGFDPPDPCKAWDDGEYLLSILAHFFRSGGEDLYYLSHPVTPTSTPATDHRCAAVTVTDPTKGCDWGD